MQTKKSKQLFKIVLEYPLGLTKTVKVRATTREIAERKAMKFHPTAKGIRHNG